MSVFPTLDFLQIENRYPKAVKRVQQWLFEQEELKAKTNEFVDPKNPEESKRQFTGMLIQMDPRKLYDVFDSLGICVSVSAYQEGNDFAYYIDTKNKNGDIYHAPDRCQAEQTAFYDAFEVLEKQL